jgi:hypothetical protein
MNVNDDGNNVSLKKINSDIIRGSFGSYLAFNNKTNLFGPATTVNIYVPNYSESNIDNYYSVRMQDSSPYNSISERYDINEINSTINLTNSN